MSDKIEKYTAKPRTGFIPTVKRLLPEALQGPARSVLHAYMRVRARFNERKLWVKLWLHKKRGGSYIDWYGDTLDAGVKPVEYIQEKLSDWINESGQEDLVIIKRLGLKPRHTLHEFGSGFLRSGHHFIRYLEKGNYSGNDASGGRVENARRLFPELIAEKGAKLHVNRDNSLDWVGRKVDYIWSHAVFGHMPEEDIEETIKNMRNVMHDDSVLLFSYDPPFGDKKDLTVHRQDSRNWSHSLDFYREIGERYGLTTEDVSSNVRDCESWRSHIHLARMTVKKSKAN